MIRVELTTAIGWRAHLNTDFEVDSRISGVVLASRRLIITSPLWCLADFTSVTLVIKDTS